MNEMAKSNLVPICDITKLLISEGYEGGVDGKSRREIMGLLAVQIRKSFKQN
tara:strand:+ start:521 stop:676 length:156 start_codon:yes stop_codon:yes gene_type:complete